MKTKTLAVCLAVMSSLFFLGACAEDDAPLDTSPYTSPYIGTLVYVPAGSFQRDAGTADISNVSAFRMSRYEITRAQYAWFFSGSDPSDATYSSGPNDPVQNVNWYQAIAFCNKLSIAEGLSPAYSVSGVDFSTLPYASIPTGYDADWAAAAADWSGNGYRLPTEMEWMWAAMGATADARSGDIYGGVNTGGYTKGYSGSTEAGGAQVNLGSYAWYGTPLTTHPAGSKAGGANELGLYDMSGNVWEWCWDWYADNGTGRNYVITGEVSDYRGAASSSSGRVCRGGSMAFGASDCSVAIRNYNNPNSQAFAYGFRVVRP